MAQVEIRELFLQAMANQGLLGEIRDGVTLELPEKNSPVSDWDLTFLSPQLWENTFYCLKLPSLGQTHSNLRKLTQ